MTPSHGYDRLIKGLHNYYNKKSEDKRRVDFYLVGGGTCLKEYINLTNEYKLDKYVHFTGFLRGKELDEIYKLASLGVGCLGLYRNGHQACSALKTKEYLIRGIPFIVAGEEIGISNKFKYMLNIPNDSSDVDIDEILKFNARIEKEDQEFIAKEMKKFAIENFKWDIIFKRVFEELI